MADLYPGLKSGPANDGAVTENFIADEAITIGSPVILVAPATGELKPRVEPSSTQGARAVGVVVGGDNDPVYGGSDENAATAAGETVRVCVNGLCKVRVNGSTGAISIGSPLTIDAVDGIAEVAGASDIVFGIAEQASTGASDFILCRVNPEGVL